MPVVQSAVAAGVALYVAHDVIGHPKPFFAPIAALIVLGVASTDRMRRVVELALGVCLGIGIGDLLVSQIGTGSWQVGLVVLMAMSAAILLGGGPVFVGEAATSGVLVATVAGRRARLALRRRPRRRHRRAVRRGRRCRRTRCASPAARRRRSSPS